MRSNESSVGSTARPRLSKFCARSSGSGLRSATFTSWQSSSLASPSTAGSPRRLSMTKSQAARSKPSPGRPSNARRRVRSSSKASRSASFVSKSIGSAAVALGSHHRSRGAGIHGEHRDDPAPRGTVLGPACAANRNSARLSIIGRRPDPQRRAYDVAELGERLGVPVRALAASGGKALDLEGLKRLSSGTSGSRSKRWSPPRGRPTSSSSGAVAFMA